MTEVTTVEAAEAERAAIAAELAARKIPEELKEPKFEPTAAGAKAGRARRQIGPVALADCDVTAEPKKLDSGRLLQRDYNTLELAQFAAEMKRMERAEKRTAAAMKKRAARYAKALEVIRAELPEQLAELAAASKGAPAALAAVEDIAEAAEVLGVSETEAAEMLAVERAVTEPVQAVRAAGVTLAEPITKADRTAAAEAARDAARPVFTFADMAASTAAEAARAALAAIGPRAAGLVVTSYGSATITVCRSIRVPAAGVAGRRAEESAAELAAAEAKLAAAELAVKAARGRKAKRPIDAAEVDANRIAASVAKLAARAALAAKLDRTAAELAALGTAADVEAFIAEPLKDLPLNKAAEAADVALRVRADIMPASFRHNGPSVKAARLVSGRGHFTMAGTGISDPTGGAAVALADGWLADLRRTEAAAEDLAARTSGRAAGLAAAAETEARRVAKKERRAEAARARRALESAARTMTDHNSKRAAKRAAR